MVEEQKWRQLVADKRERQKKAIPKDWLITPPPEAQLDVTGIPSHCGLLSASDLEITETDDVAVILNKLASGEWTSLAVTTAYYKRAIIAHQLTNCLTEIFVEQALQRATLLDEQFKKTGKPVGPLHGLPVSLKDQLRMKGLEATIGYVSYIGHYAERDSILVQILYDAGAVPFVRTNVPQTLMWPETYNEVFGRTTNPFNRKLTSGGSSGGEGALIALKGSPLGIGSDIGGSVRIPSSYNGLYGLRPSYGRIPYGGAANSMEGQDSVPSVLGPMSRSLSGIKALLKAVIAGKPWTKDPLAVRKVWDESAYQLNEHGEGKDLVFAIMWHDGSLLPHPPIMRGVEMVRDALITAGYKVIDWKPYKHAEICKNLSNIWDAGATDDYNAVTSFSGEPVIESMSLAEDMATQLSADFRPASNGISAYKLWQYQKEKLQYRTEYLEYWEATKDITGTGRPVDAIIAPVAPYTAVPHGHSRSVSYTMVWNSLDYVATVIPVSKTDPSIDVVRPAHDFLSDVDRQHYESYDPNVFANAPICIQVIGRTLEEEAVLAMTERVDAAVKFFKSQTK